MTPHDVHAGFGTVRGTQEVLMEEEECLCLVYFPSTSAHGREVRGKQTKHSPSSPRTHGVYLVDARREKHS